MFGSRVSESPLTPHKNAPRCLLEPTPRSPQIRLSARLAIEPWGTVIGEEVVGTDETKDTLDAPWAGFDRSPRSTGAGSSDGAGESHGQPKVVGFGSAATTTPGRPHTAPSQAPDATRVADLRGRLGEWGSTAPEELDEQDAQEHEHGNGDDGSGGRR